MTKKIYLFGYPVKGAASPVVMQAVCDHFKLDVKCDYLELEDASKLPEVVGQVRSGEILGLLVTMPYKQSIIPLIGRLDEEAQRIGAVNTVYQDGGEIVGHNSDVTGFTRSLIGDGGFDPKGKRVTILGAGGAASTCGFTLARMGAKSITIVNRTRSKGEQLASMLKPLCPEVHIMEYNDQHLKEAIQNSELVVNATPIGMIHTPVEGETPVKEQIFTKGQVAFDVIYKPTETPFLKMAREAGAQTINGLAWMVYGTAEALGFFIKQEPNTDVMFDAARKLAKESGW